MIAPIDGALRAKVAHLSPRERQVVALAAQGLTDKEMTLCLGVSLHTLRTYWKRMRAKQGVASRAAIVHEWTKSRLGQVSHLAPFRRVFLDFDQASVDWGAAGSQAGPSRVLHPQDFTAVQRLQHDLMRGCIPAASSTYRMLAPEGLTRVYYLGTALFEDSPVPRGLQNLCFDVLEDAQPSVKGGGCWISNRSRGVFHADHECCRLFGVDPGRSADPDAFASRLLGPASDALEEFFGAPASASTRIFIGAVKVLGEDARPTELWLQTSLESWADGQVLARGQVLPIEATTLL